MTAIEISLNDGQISLRNILDTRFTDARRYFDERAQYLKSDEFYERDDLSVLFEYFSILTEREILEKIFVRVAYDKSGRIFDRLDIHDDRVYIERLKSLMGHVRWEDYIMKLFITNRLITAHHLEKIKYFLGDDGFIRMFNERQDIAFYPYFHQDAVEYLRTLARDGVIYDILLSCPNRIIYLSNIEKYLSQKTFDEQTIIGVKNWIFGGLANKDVTGVNFVRDTQANNLRAYNNGCLYYLLQNNSLTEDMKSDVLREAGRLGLSPESIDDFRRRIFSEITRHLNTLLPS